MHIISMIKQLLLIISLLFLSCEQKIQKAIKYNELVNTSKATIKTDSTLNCYDFLTEIIRSSNFPFGKLNPKKVNILIDTEDDEKIRIKLFIDTDGTGTMAG